MCNKMQKINLEIIIKDFKLKKKSKMFLSRLIIY